jgi:hypothetical protein
MSVLPCFWPSLGQGQPTEVRRDAFYGGVGTVAPYGFLLPGPAVVAGSAC